MAQFERVDSFDVTYADSFTRPELKIREDRVHRDGQKAGKGIGEKRIYCGRDEKALDEFFRFDRIKAFFIQKDDLEEYLRDIKKEYLDPAYNYGGGVRQTFRLYEEYKAKLDALKEDRLYLHFSKTYDRQGRYYLVLPTRSRESKSEHENYSFIRDICLPRVTRLLFVKLIDLETQEWYIYVKPFYGDRLTGAKARERAAQSNLRDEKSGRVRDGQGKYRDAVFNLYPYCVVTRVTDPSLLNACHIKDYARCDRNERFDKYNGFTMTPTIHALFDLGYLSFDDKGNMILSDFLRNMDRKCLHLTGTVRIAIPEETKKYLEWHNNNIFIRTSRGVDIK